MTADEALARIEASPRGAKVGAFFDLDGTVVSGFTGGAFYGERLRRREIGPLELARTALVLADSGMGGDPARLGELGVAGLRGTAEEDLEELGERLFAQRTATTIRPDARALVEAHRRRGHTVVIASSATRFQVEPVARDLGIQHVLCSKLETDGGLLTGRFDGGMLWGEAKARAVRGLMRSRRLTRRETFGYANGAEDVAFLSSIGVPHAVNPERRLRAVAERHGWPVLALSDPARADARSLAGTIAAIAGLNIGLGIGLGIGLLRRDRRLGSDVACALGFEAFLAMAGVRLNVVGEHHLWAHRPAVFVMNHQSGLDAMIVGALLHERFSGLGKAEARYSPATFLLGQALDAVFIDRSDPADARAQLGQLTQRLADGLSVFVAPEGTRSPTPVLAPFKTGAFHVAREAGVPVVPIVLRNAYALMPGAAKTIRPGTVDVAVLEAIPTDGWTAASARADAAAVRQRFADTLEHRPGA